MSFQQVYNPGVKKKSFFKGSLVSLFLCAIWMVQVSDLSKGKPNFKEPCVVKQYTSLLRVSWLPLWDDSRRHMFWHAPLCLNEKSIYGHSISWYLLSMLESNHCYKHFALKQDSYNGIILARYRSGVDLQEARLHNVPLRHPNRQIFVSSYFCIMYNASSVGANVTKNLWLPQSLLLWWRE